MSSEPSQRLLLVGGGEGRRATLSTALAGDGRVLLVVDDLPAAVELLARVELAALLLDVSAAAAHPSLLPALAERPRHCPLLVLYGVYEAAATVLAVEHAAPDGMLAYDAEDDAGWPALLGAALERASSRRLRRAEHARLAEQVDLLRRRLDGALAAARMGYLDWDLRTDRIVLSEEICRLYGLRKEEVQSTSELVQRAVHPDDLERVRGALERAIRGEERYDIEHRVVRPDGTTLWVASSAELERDAEGRPARLLGVSRDITERRLQQQQIERLSRVHAMLSEVNEVVVRVGGSATLLADACRIAVDRGGYRMAWVGLVDEGAERVGVAASHGEVGDYLESLDIRLDGGPRSRGPTGRAALERRTVASDDIATDPRMKPWRERALAHGFAASAALPMIASGRLWGVLNLYAGEAGAFDEQEVELLEELAADIGFGLAHLDEHHRLQQSEQALAHRLEQQRAVAHLGRVALAGASPGELMVQATAALCRCLPIELSEVLELQRDGTLRLAAGQGWPPGLVGSATVGTGRDSQPGYTLLQHEPVVFEDLATEPRFSGSELLTSHGVVSGLSAAIGSPEAPWGVLGAHSRSRQRFEEHDVAFLQAVADVLGQAIARRAAEAQLQRAQRLEVVGRLSGGVAHDFNNLLTVVLAAVDELGSRVAGDAEALEEVATIERAANRAAALTRQLLAFSRRQPRQPRRLDLNGVVAATSKLLARTVGEDVSLEVVLDERPCPVVADTAQLEQVLMNLAVNARDAMPKGGRLCIATRRVDDAGPAREAAERRDAGTWVVLEVSDTGVGMDEETRLRAFEPFFTTKDVGRGTGLGLSTVFGIVEQSGGRLELDSAPGEGSRFRIHLPLAAEEGERGATGSPGPAPPERGASEAILLVEDDIGVRRMVRRILGRWGYQVLEADGAAAAIEQLAARDGRFDLMLSDVVMPGDSGVELCTEVRRRWPSVPVLLMSGYVETTLDPELTGVDCALLGKPFSVAELLEAVKRAIACGGRRP